MACKAPHVGSIPTAASIRFWPCDLRKRLSQGLFRCLDEPRRLPSEHATKHRHSPPRTSRWYVFGTRDGTKLVRPVSIHETPQGHWRARVRTRTGRQITKTFKLKADARVWERDRLREKDEGQLVGTSKLTVAEWADQWLAGARNLAPSSVATYRRDLDRYILPVLGELKLSALTPERIDAYLTAGLAEYAPSTVHRHYRTINRLCRVAVLRGHLVANPCDAVQAPKVPRQEMRYLQAAQLERLADAIDPRYRAWVLVAGYGGLRWGELQALKPEHVDGHELTVLEQLSGELKTDGSRRRVVLPPSVGVELAAHMAAYPGEYVFTRPTGEPLSHSSFNNNKFKKALAAAGLDTGLRMHDLRHTACSIWIQSGAHPKLVADMAGHSSIMVTMDRYSHLFPAMHEEVAVKVDEIRKAGGKHLRAV